MAQEGAKHNDPAAVAASSEAITAAGGVAQGIVWDLADISSIDRHIGESESTFGAVEILVSFAGRPPPTSVSGQSAKAWHKFFNMMVLSVINITDRVLPNMRKAK